MTIPFKADAPLRDYTTLKIGGPAKRLYEPACISDIRTILQEARSQEQPVYIIGNGSNLLFDDEGYDGWIIRLAEKFSGAEDTGGGRVRILSGTSNSDAAEWMAKRGLSGYEFASGIPGTIGGAVMMNAGAYNGELMDVLVSVDYMDMDGRIHTISKDDMELGYRTSWFTTHPGVILSAVFQLAPADPKEIQAKIDDLHDRRWSKQPMDECSAGSTFKRPEKGYASLLIRECGLAGLSVGDAQVSEKHTGFLINKGNASARSFLELISLVQHIVRERTGIELQPEVKIIRSCTSDQKAVSDKNGTNSQH